MISPSQPAVALAIAATHACAQCTLSPGFEGPSLRSSFGTTVEISADGTVALAGGPQFEQSRGAVRTFRRDGDLWTEGPTLLGTAEGDSFGLHIAMNGAGDTALVGAPGALSPESRRGAVSVYRREAEAWTLDQVWTSPANFSEPFGVRVAFAETGRTAAVSDESAVWTRDRNDGAWGPWIEVVPATPIESPFIVFGDQIALSDDGGLLAITVGRATFPASERVFVFRRDGATWSEIARLEGTLAPGQTLNDFGGSLAFAGTDLFVTDRGADEVRYGPDQNIIGPPLFRFAAEGDGYNPVPQILIPPPGLAAPTGNGSFSARILGRVAARNDTVVVGGSPNLRLDGESVGGVVYKLTKRDGAWRFTDRITANPDSFGQISGFGAAADIASDGLTTIIGEPTATIAGEFGVGRIHFGDQAVSFADYRVQSVLASVELQFPGFPAQFFAERFSGALEIIYSEACEGGPATARLESFVLAPEDDTYDLEWAEGAGITFSNIRIRLSEPTEASGVDDDDELILSGNFRFSADMSPLVAGQTLRSTTLPVAFDFDLREMTASFSSGTLESFTLAPAPFSGPIDLGLDDANPTASLDIAIEADRICLPDLAPPEAALTPADIQQHLLAAEAAHDTADLTREGRIDFRDTLKFLARFDAGCP